MLAWRTAFPDCQDIEPLSGVFQEHAGYVATQASYSTLGTEPLRGGQTRQSGKRGRRELEQELPELLGAEDVAVLQAALRDFQHKRISLKRGKKPVPCEEIKKAVMSEWSSARRKWLEYCQTEAEVCDVLRFYLEELQAAEDDAKAAPPERVCQRPSVWDSHCACAYHSRSLSLSHLPHACLNTKPKITPPLGCSLPHGLPSRLPWARQGGACRAEGGRNPPGARAGV